MSFDQPPVNSDELLLLRVTPQTAREMQGSTPSAHLPEQHAQKQRTLKNFFLLLAILCLYGIGTFPLAAHLLLSSHRSQSTPSSSTPGITVKEGKCPTDSTNLPYLPSAPASIPSEASQVWSQAGYSKEDLTSASSCAASFLLAYLSFDYRQTQTFVACTSMLSAGGQERFYGHAADSSADMHGDPFWSASMQEQQVRQSAQVRSPVLQQAQFKNERMFAWMQVQFQLTIYRGNEVLNNSDDITVLVISVPHEASQKQTLWQISDWRNGNGAFNLATPY